MAAAAPFFVLGGIGGRHFGVQPPWKFGGFPMSSALWEKALRRALPDPTLSRPRRHWGKALRFTPSPGGFLIPSTALGEGPRRLCPPACTLPWHLRAPPPNPMFPRRCNRVPRIFIADTCEAEGFCYDPPNAEIIILFWGDL
jgi:hypothetical protein